MKRIIGAMLATAFVCGLGQSARAEVDKDVKAVLDKAVKALGGDEKLGAFKAATWKAKGKINIGGSDNEFTSQTTVQGLDRIRSEFEGEFMGNKIKGVTVLDGDKGWRKLGDMGMEMDKDAVANEKRNLYLQLVPATLLPLRGKDFKVKVAGEEKVAGKAAVGLRITGPDGKEFTLFFDKESGLPVKQVAKVIGFGGEEFTQETTYGGYKDFDGLKRATRFESKRDGEKFIEIEITEFKVLKNVGPKTFAEP